MAGVPYNSTPGLAGLLANGPWEAANLLPIETNRATGQRRAAVPKSIWEALQLLGAPQKAATGGYQLMVDPNTGENYYGGMAEDATGLAGLLLGGGSAIPKPTGSLGIFGGVMANTADKAALAQAEKMAAAGVSRDDIWNATGWFKGKDGKWRFEIDDSKSAVEVSNTALGGASPDRVVPLSNVLKHDKAYDAYPDAGAIRANFRMDAGGQEGSYAPPRTVGNRLIEGIAAQGATRHDIKSVGLHELQHAIQTRENFANGANPAFAEASRDEVWAAAKSAYEDTSRTTKDDDDLLFELTGKRPKPAPPMKPWGELTEREKLHWLQAGRDRLYFRSAGEAEARNVQNRQTLTAEQRRAKAPWLTQDVPDEKQIVR